MRKIVISDIHGCYPELLELLDKVNYSVKNDKLIILGDMVDRGKHSREVVQHIMNLTEQGNVEVVKGNHEDLFLYWLDTPDNQFPEYLLKIGGINTLESFVKMDSNSTIQTVKEEILLNYKKELEFLKGLPLYIEGEHFNFVHAGIDPFYEDWRNTSERDFLYIREFFYRVPHSHNKTFVFGHTPTSYLHEDGVSNEVWFGNKIIGIDGGCVFGGQLNALIIEGDTFLTESVQSKLNTSDNKREKRK